MDICRLCCSTKFVNNYIFDEENALYVKMSLYLPIKVFKNDRLPQKICDKCSCKVNDFYQFCNEAIEIQNRLHATLLAFSCSDTSTVDLSVVKTDTHSPPFPHPHLQLQQRTSQVSPRCDQSTQTDLDITPTSNSALPANNVTIKVEIEPNPPSPPEVKIESDFIDTNSYGTFNNVPSDNSDDISLIDLKKKKSKDVNYDSVCENTKGKRRKSKKNAHSDITESDIKPIPDESNGELKFSDDFEDIKKKVKKELSDDDIHHCCMCFEQCHSRVEMLKHYRQHGRALPPSELPPPPPPPDTDPLRCPRCKKTVPAGGGAWAAHWLRHREQDTRPYRCAVCARTYRTHLQILKHGQTHKYVEEGGAEPMDSRFFCDLCPEGFVYMRCLVSHRSLAHPEALARPLAVRCGCCERTFAHLNSLRRHVRARRGQRDHLCYVCGKALSSQEHLKFHIRIHTGYKPNVCKTCGKGFVKKCNLTLHERVHSGEKPHVCSHCGKAFSQRSTLVIHERYHSGARPYACALCGRGFVAKGLLSMHLKSTCI